MLQLQANVNCAVNAETDKSLFLFHACLCAYMRDKNVNMTHPVAITFSTLKKGQCYIQCSCTLSPKMLWGGLKVE